MYKSVPNADKGRGKKIQKIRGHHVLKLPCVLFGQSSVLVWIGNDDDCKFLHDSSLKITRFVPITFASSERAFFPLL